MEDSHTSHSHPDSYPEKERQQENHQQKVFLIRLSNAVKHKDAINKIISKQKMKLCNNSFFKKKKKSIMWNSKLHLQTKEMLKNCLLG